MNAFSNLTTLAIDLKEFVSHKYLLIALVATMIVGSAGLNNDWVNRDDHQYVLRNNLIQGPLSEQLSDLLTEPVMGNYHPMTMLSLKIDYLVWGNNALGYHITNLLLHLLSVGLAYFFFFLLTKDPFGSGLIALLFGIHPMHVESVAWISARKDVLYVALLLMSMIYWLYHIRNIEHKNYKTYALVSFALSILSKPMAVILPLALLLVDYHEKRPLTWNLLKEKWLFFVLSLIGGILAIRTQDSSGALDAIAAPGFLDKLTFASYSFSNYLFKAFVPVHLSAFHPYPDFEEALPSYYLLSWIAVFLVLGLLVKFRNNRQLVFGMGIFLVAIAPVLQLLSVGDAITAERYTYFSYFGLFFLMAIGIDRLKSYPRTKVSNILGLILIVVLASYGLVAHNRYSVWKNGETLWSDIIEKYPLNYLGYGTRGNYYLSQRNIEAALVDYNKSIELNSEFPGTLINRGLILRQSGRPEDALKDFNRVIELAPTSHIYLNRGILHRDMNAWDKSLKDLTEAINLDTSNGQAFLERGVLYTQTNNYESAIQDYTQTLQRQPNNGAAYFYRGDAYCSINELDKGIEDLSRAIALNPSYATSYFLRSKAHKINGSLELAKQDAITASQLGFILPSGYLDEF